VIFDVVVLGLGYVGLPLAQQATRAGMRVLGFDVNAKVVASLAAGRSHVDDLGDADVAEMLAGGFRTSTDESLIASAGTAVICVPTPLAEGDGPDLRAVVGATEAIGRNLRPGMLVVLESTTYPGTTDEVVRPLLEKLSGLTAGIDFHLAFSPERIDPGNERFGPRNTPKVVGGYTRDCADRVAAFYGRFVDTVVRTKGTREAETAKLLENTFRSVNIALANEFALSCRKIGVDPWEVIEAAATKPFGFMPFYPGPGIGGHCIPVDPHYMSWKVRLTGYETQFIALADRINRAMTEHVVTVLAEALNGRGRAVRGASILVLGVTYKPDVNDIRESTAVEIIEMLARKGACVTYADPFVPQLSLDCLKLTAVEPSPGALAAVDCVLILTNHSRFDYAAIAAHAPLVVDTRNAMKAFRVSGSSIVTL